MTTEDRHSSTFHRCPYFAGNWVVPLDASRVSGIPETSDFCDTDICFPPAQHFGSRNDPRYLPTITEGGRDFDLLARCKTRGSGKSLV